MGVMIVVPSFSKRDECHPTAISRGVGCLVSPRAPHVSGGVDQPGGVKIQDSAKKDAPEEKGPSAEGEKDSTKDGHGNPMPPADPDVKFVPAKIRDVGKENRRVIMNALTGQDPTHMGP